MEDKLFTNVINNDQHVLFYTLPDHNNNLYDLRPKWHKLTLAIKGDAKKLFLKGNFSKTLTSWYIATDWIFIIIILPYIVYLRYICSFISLIYGCVLSAEFYTLNWTELTADDNDNMSYFLLQKTTVYTGAAEPRGPGGQLTPQFFRCGVHIWMWTPTFCEDQLVHQCCWQHV